MVLAPAAPQAFHVVLPDVAVAAHDLQTADFDRSAQVRAYDDRA